MSTVTTLIPGELSETELRRRLSLVRSVEVPLVSSTVVRDRREAGLDDLLPGGTAATALSYFVDVNVPTEDGSSSFEWLRVGWVARTRDGWTARYAIGHASTRAVRGSKRYEAADDVVLDLLDHEDRFVAGARYSYLEALAETYGTTVDALLADENRDRRGGYEGPGGYGR